MFDDFFLLLCIWIGGLVASYRVYRKHGKNVFMAGLLCITWPMGLGYFLASIFTHPDL